MANFNGGFWLECVTITSLHQGLSMIVLTNSDLIYRPRNGLVGRCHEGMERNVNLDTFLNKLLG